MRIVEGYRMEIGHPGYKEEETTMIHVSVGIWNLMLTMK